MLKTRTIVALGLLAVAAAGVTYVQTRPDPHARDLPGQGQAVAGAPAPLARDAVDELTIEEPGKPKVVLKKDGAAWTLSEPLADAADGRAVDNALKVLAELVFRDVVAERQDSHAKLAIGDDQVVKVTASGGGKPLLSLWIGQQGQVRVNGEARVWSVGKMNRPAFTKDLKLWRNREVLRLDKAQVASVEVVAAGQKVAARREAPPAPPADASADGGVPPPPVAQPDTWTLTDGQAVVGANLDTTVPTGMLSTLTRLDLAEFADDATPEAAGLAPPRLVAAAVLTDGSRKAVELGADDGTFVFARVEGTPRIFKLRKTTADTLARPALQWRDKTLAKVDGKDVVKVEITIGKTGETLVFTRKDADTWTADRPADLAKDLDTGKVQGIAAGFSNLRAQSLSERPASDAKTGLAKPTGRVRLSTKAGPAVELVVGALEGSSYHVQLAGRPDVYMVASVVVDRWLKGAADFKKTDAAPAHAHAE